MRSYLKESMMDIEARPGLESMTLEAQWGLNVTVIPDSTYRMLLGYKMPSLI